MILNKYRSNAERRIAEWFSSNGIKFQYEVTKFPYQTTVRSGECLECGATSKKGKVVQHHIYTADFSFPDYPFHVEVKGRLSPSDRNKMIQVKKANPEARIYLTLLADNKLRKDKEKRYSDWCRETGYPYSIKIPLLKWFGK